VQNELSQLERSPRNYGLIHADFAPENLMVDGERIRLLDFDDAGYGWHLFEVVTSLYFHIGQPYFDAIERAMLEGYRSEQRLSAEDKRCCRCSMPPGLHVPRLGPYSRKPRRPRIGADAGHLCCGVATHASGPALEDRNPIKSAVRSPTASAAYTEPLFVKMNVLGAGVPCSFATAGTSQPGITNSSTGGCSPAAATTT
jgi:hypothetical protein